MNAVQKTLSLSFGALFLAGCATQTTLAPLHAAQQLCAVTHDPAACAQVPALQANADEEARTNGLTAAALILLAPLALVAAGATYQPDTVVIIRH